MKKYLSLLLAICLIVVMTPAMAFAETQLVSAQVNTDDIVILATSDVHCGISDDIGYEGFVAYKKAMKAQYANVTLVDCGDAVQGATVGTLSKGEYPVEIMNEVGYDICVPGNHEFDYGMDQFLNVIVKNNKAAYTSCNFRTIADSKAILNQYVMKTYGTKKVAYVGISTPETLTKSSPVYFQDKNGNWIYDFCNDETGEALYKQVQTAVDAAKAAGADYVVALAHLGDDPDTAVWKSSDVIANTTGIDVLADGHAHQTHIKVVKNKAGKDVKCIATGTKFSAFGKVVIAKDGTITCELFDKTTAAEKDADMTAFIEGINKKVSDLADKVVAKSDVTLTGTQKDATGLRPVRCQELAIGDLCADAYLAVSGADIAFVNGGGIRADIAKGDITYGDVINIHPYGNKLCVCEATGQEILDALELGSKSVGKGESGGFLQVAGMTYSINPYIESTVVLDEMGMFVEVAGERKVSDVKVGGVAIDPEKTYTLACHNYKLKQCGDGYTMFKDNKFIQDEVMLDNQVLITYITDKLNGAIGSKYAEPQGRIKILSVAEAIQPALDVKDAKIADLENKLAVAEYKCVVKATAAKKAVELTWNACEANGVEYRVYQSAKKTKGFKKVVQTADTAYTVKKLTTGQTYYFKVRAVIKTAAGKNYYGHYSTVKSAKVK